MERNVLGGPLESCSSDPLTGFYRDGCCRTGPGDLGSHTICAVVTAEFLEYQQGIGNDLSTPVPEYEFPGLKPGDRWCVTTHAWLRACAGRRVVRRPRLDARARAGCRAPRAAQGVCGRRAGRPGLDHRVSAARA